MYFKLKNIARGVYKTNMKTRKILIAIIFGVLTGLIAVAFFIVKRKIERLPEKSYFLNYNLSNMNVKEVDEFLDKKINAKLKNERIKLHVVRDMYYLSPSKINAHFSADEVFKYLKNLHKNRNEHIPKIKYNKNILKKLLTTLSEQTKVAPKKYLYKVLQDSVIVKAGVNGKKINVDETLKQIENSMQKMNFREIIPKAEKILSNISLINLKEIKQKVDVNVKDAVFRMVNGKRTYENEVIGKNMSLKKAKEIVVNPAAGKYLIPLKVIKPTETVSSLKARHEDPSAPHVLASFTTNFNRSVSNRVHNIKIAANAISGTVILPGEEFSFRDTAGRASGYVEAPTYANGKKTKGIGGGMCQVSSTLFNTALRANMNITQRHCHSKRVSYLPDGRDAGYSGSGVNFKFINPLKNPIKITASVSNSSVTINILGTKLPEENYKVNLESHVTSKTPTNLKAVLNVTVTLNGNVVKTKTYYSSYDLT